MNDQEILDIVKAHMDGEEIEQSTTSGWKPFDGTWSFNWCEYRVAPRKPLECWVNEYGNAISPYNWSSPEKAIKNADGATRTAVHMIEKMDDWVTDRDPPPKDEMYDVTLEDNKTKVRNTFAMYYRADSGFPDNKGITVIAWRPRPEPWGDE